MSHIVEKWEELTVSVSTIKVVDQSIDVVFRRVTFSLNATNVSLLSCFRTSVSVKHIPSVNTTGSAVYIQPTRSERRTHSVGSRSYKKKKEKKLEKDKDQMSVSKIMLIIWVRLSRNVQLVSGGGILSSFPLNIINVCTLKHRPLASWKK